MRIEKVSSGFRIDLIGQQAEKMRDGNRLLKPNCCNIDTKNPFGYFNTSVQKNIYCGPKVSGRPLSTRARKPPLYLPDGYSFFIPIAATTLSSPPVP